MLRASNDRQRRPKAARDTDTGKNEGSEIPAGAVADGAAVREGALVGDELGRLMRLVAAWKQRVRDEGGGDRLLLLRLAKGGPLRATDLAADTLLDLSTVSRQIRSLVDRGLVERRPDPEDGRGTLLSPTAAGLAAVERYRAHRDRKMAEALAGWPAADRQDFARLLARFNDDFAERHVRPVCAHPPGHTAAAGAGPAPPPGGAAPRPHARPHPLPHDHRASRPTGQTQETSQ